ncbi:MFS transporter [Aeromicrobium sp. 50.2.37]|uniref:MFS transporter n=1 Tax=Aeromicrobium sp. 50.2.37 TaxID=2969305 RepID=UPI00214FD548|nr:MFS transporter [Aeromicrobium sp. 50.2.37]MCR4514250.1 MFS transporter [Aeromicrobium sp. 50.2.37]
MGRLSGVAGAVLTDVRPLRASPAYRRLWLGQTVSAFGQQMTIVAIAYEVYSLTTSSFSVGLIGLAGLLPLVLGGLYGGALADAFDRRRVALVSALGLWLCSMALVAHSLAGVDSVGFLYGLVAVQSALFAVNQPARSAMLPRLLPADLLPAANALGMAATNLSFTAGPLLGGLLIAWKGVDAAYLVDVVLFVAALYSLFRLPALPPLTRQPVPGLRSVVEGLRFLRTAPNVRMTFVIDLFAMVLAQPRALFPALAVTVFATGPETLGLLQAAPGIGAVVAFLVSGWVSRVHRHGVAVVAAVCVYGAAVSAAGVSVFSGASLLWLCVLMLACSGAADMVSAAYRSTILQTAAPDELRGRMQGVFIVVVAGGPRLGDFVMGSLAGLAGEAWAMTIGGALCVAATAWFGLRSRGFRAYDAREPTP